MSWFKKWEKYKETNAINTEESNNVEVKKEDQMTDVNNDYPGPIINDDIMVFEAILRDPDEVAFRDTNYPIRSNLKEKVDFILIPQILWKLWKSIYGGFDLPRIKHAGTNDTPSYTDVFLQRICLIFRPTHEFLPKNYQTVYVRKSGTVEDLLGKCTRIYSKICQEVNKAAPKEDLKLRLWKISDKEIIEREESSTRLRSNKKPIGLEGVVLENKTTIEDLALSEMTAILVETWNGNEGPLFVEEKIRKTSGAGKTKTFDIKNFENEGLEYLKIPIQDLLDPDSKCGCTGLEILGEYMLYE